MCREFPVFFVNQDSRRYVVNVSVHVEWLLIYLFTHAPHIRSTPFSDRTVTYLYPSKNSRRCHLILLSRRLTRPCAKLTTHPSLTRLPCRHTNTPARNAGTNLSSFSR